MKNKNSKNTILSFCLIFIFMGVSNLSFTQEVSIDFPKGKININGAGNLNLEGYDGTEVLIFEILYEQNRPDLMESLTKINSRKPNHWKKDFDVEYKIKGSELTLDIHGRSGRYHIKIPRNLDVSVTAHGRDYYYYDGLKNLNFNNLDGELEVFTDGAIDVNLQNTSGSVSIVTYGNITATYEKLPTSGVLSFDTYLGYVNLSIPKNSSANFSLTAKKGDIYSNLISKQKNDKSAKAIKAKLGEGKIDIIVNAEAGGDIYLRKWENEK